MPGIAGIISRQRPANDCRSQVEAMVTRMAHESFYRTGLHAYERLGLSIGWVTHEGSFSDCLPIWNESNDICLIFSGENFADNPDVDALRAKGHQFKPGDASYLVHLYEEMGCAFLEQLNGWFSGLLIDQHRDYRQSFPLRRSGKYRSIRSKS